MRNFLSIIFICLAVRVFAHNEMKEEWLNGWTAGIFSVKSGQYEQAIIAYSQAIDLLEEETDRYEHFYVYNSRGQAYLFADRYQEALSDFKKVAETDCVLLTDKIIAQWGITRCYAHLEDLENFSQEFAKLREIDPHYPKVESTKEYLIFRNFHSDSPCAKKNFVKALIKLDICSQVDDVIFTNSGVCLVKKQTDCGCSQKESFLSNTQDEEKCKYWCDRVINAAFVMCSNKFKSIKCQWLCVEIVEGLKKGCYWCCEGEGFYKKCVKPFEDFLAQVPCDPLWD